MNHYVKVFAFLAISVVAQTQATDAKNVVKDEVTHSRVARMVASVKATPSAVFGAVKSALTTVTVTPFFGTCNFVKAHPVIATSATLVTVAATAAAVYAYNNMQAEDIEDNE